MANPSRKSKTTKGKVATGITLPATASGSLESRRAWLMVLAVETGRTDLQDFFEQCLRAHAIDTLKSL